MDLLEERRGEVLWLTFDRPRSRNALTFAMYDRLTTIAHVVNSDDALRCVVLTGAGEAFVSGTDIAQLRDLKTQADVLAYEARVEGALDELRGIRIPTIAAIQGACTGGGLAIAASCDMRIASPSARFAVPIARTLGNGLAMASIEALVDLVGAALAKELVFTARVLGAAEACRIGLVNELVESEEALLPRVQELAVQIAGNAPLTIRAAKEGVRRIIQRGRLSAPDGQDLMLMCYLSQDFREGVEAFLEKRKPAWRGV